MGDGATNAASEFAYRKLDETRGERMRRGLIYVIVIAAAILVTLATPAIYMAIVGPNDANGWTVFAIFMTVFVLAILVTVWITQRSKIAVNRLKREINGAIARDIGFTYEPEAMRPPEFKEAASAP